MQRPQAILFDLDGVFWEGDQPIVGGAEVLRWCRQRGIAHLFMTNTTSRPRSALVDKFAAFGMPIGSDELITPPVAALQWLQTQRAEPVALFVPAATRTEFAGLELLPDGAEHGARAVVVGDLGEAWDYAELNRAFRLLMAADAVELIALGMTRYWKDRGRLRLDTGPFVQALAYASGRAPVVLGKPGAAFFRAAVERMGVEAGQTVMIGDDVLTDVQAAQAAGLSGVLVRTGKFRPSDLDAAVRPAAVLDSVADLPRWWLQQEGR